MGWWGYAKRQQFHVLWHLCYFAKFLNPRSLHCYNFEDFIGRMVTAAKACLASTPMYRLGDKVMQNFRLILWLMLANLHVQWS